MEIVDISPLSVKFLSREEIQAYQFLLTRELARRAAADCVVVTVRERANARDGPAVGDDLDLPPPLSSDVHDPLLQHARSTETSTRTEQIDDPWLSIPMRTIGVTKRQIHAMEK
jgi:hypothetical protein